MLIFSSPLLSAFSFPPSHGRPRNRCRPASNRVRCGYLCREQWVLVAGLVIDGGRCVLCGLCSHSHSSFLRCDPVRFSRFAAAGGKKFGGEAGGSETLIGKKGLLMHNLSLHLRLSTYSFGSLAAPLLTTFNTQ